MKYPSKISYGLVLFILTVLIGAYIPMISSRIWSGLIINSLVLIFITHLFLNTFYIIDGESLIVKSSFLINKKIPIHTILTISETNNPISAPATSLDRLEIVYDHNMSIFISPKDKSGFIDHITRINPKIEVRYKTENKS